MKKKVLDQVEFSFHVFFRGPGFRGKAEVLSSKTGITDFDKALEHFGVHAPNAEVTKAVEYRRGPGEGDKWTRKSERVFKEDEEDDAPALDGEPVAEAVSSPEVEG